MINDWQLTESRNCDEEGEMDGVETLYNVIVRAKPWFCLPTYKPTQLGCAEKGFHRVDPMILARSSTQHSLCDDTAWFWVSTWGSADEIPPADGGIPDFTSVKQYCENCSFVYPNLCVGLDIVVHPNIT